MTIAHYLAQIAPQLKAECVCFWFAAALNNVSDALCARMEV